MEVLQTAAKGFLLHCQFEKNLSIKTLKAYKIDLLQLETYLEKSCNTYDVTEITRHHIREFLSSISSLRPKSIKRKIAVVKALFNYLEFEDKIAINPFRKMRIRIKEDKKLPTVMTIQEISRIIKKAYDCKKGVVAQNSYAYLESIRNIVVIELLFSTGARVSEIANLKAENIQLDSGSFLFKGKGNKERIVHVCSQEAIILLKKYYTLFKDRMLFTGGYFLVNRFNKRLSDQSIRNVVKKFAARAGLSRRITPHVFRHSFATLLLEKDVDIRYIQNLLGHSSIITTQLYTHVNRAKQKQILRTKHPRKDIVLSSPSE